MKRFSALLALCAGNSPVTVEFPSQRPVTRSFDLMFFFICARIKGWLSNRDAGDLRRHRAHYDVTVMVLARSQWEFVPVHLLICCLVSHADVIEGVNGRVLLRAIHAANQAIIIRVIEEGERISIFMQPFSWQHYPVSLKTRTSSLLSLSSGLQLSSLKVECHADEFVVNYHYDDVKMGAIASQIISLTIVYSTVYSDPDQRKHQRSASLAFVRGIHRDRWIPRTKGQLRGKCFHLMTSSCCTGSCYFDKFRYIHWWQIRQRDNISIPLVNGYVPIVSLLYRKYMSSMNLVLINTFHQYTMNIWYFY